MSAEHLVCFALFVLGVASKHLDGLELAVGVAGEFVVHLLGVALGEEFDVFLALAAKDGADGGEGGIYHVLHEVVPLDEEVGVVLSDAEGG